MTAGERHEAGYPAALGEKCAALLGSPWPVGAGTLLAFLLLVALPVLAGHNDYVLQVFTQALLLASLALAWNILGISGGISLGHAAFFGIGAYVSALLSTAQNLPVWVSIPLAGTAAAALGLAAGLICLRLRGAYFALATLAFVEIPRVITANWDAVTHGSLGLVGLPGLPAWHWGSWHVDLAASLTAAYYFVFAYALILLGIVRVIQHSSFGLGFQALREEETAAQSIGIPVTALRLLAFAVSAFFAGMCGACYAHLVRYIEPGLVYGIYFSAIPLVFSICGGRFTVLGPALAAILIYPLDQFVFHPLLPAGHEFLYGLVLVLTVLFMPAGFWGRFGKVS